MDNQTPPPWTRHQVPDNPHGLTGVDHVALAAHDPIRAARFYVEVLGGTMYYATGFSEEERSQRRSPHSFVHVGGVLVQTGYPNDGKTFPDPQSKSYWPHLAFSATPDVLDRMCEQLRAHRVPFSGPHSHLNVEAVSIYFLDPEGNKLEVCTWDPYPADEVTLLGPGGVAIDWASLVHQWRPTGERLAASP